MSDLPPLVLDENKKQAIFNAINENITFPDVAQPGDVFTEDIMTQYNVDHSKAREIMRKLVQKYPERFRMVNVLIPGSYHNRPGRAMRLIESQTVPSETRQESSSLPPVAP
jgi:hypothetical protein